MIQQLPKMKCSKCGSIRSESFKRNTLSGLDRGWENGIRCLSCGHESTTSTGNTNKDYFTKTQWVARDKTDCTF